MKTPAWIAVALVGTLLSMGPLAPMVTVAEAQQQMQQATPAPPVEPPLTSQVPGQEMRPADPSESMMLPANEPVTSHEPTAGDATGAAVMNVVYIPGKAFLCTAGVITSTVLLVVTFGSAYRAARSVFLEGCSSPWALTAEHVSGKIPGPGDPGYDPANW